MNFSEYKRQLNEFYHPFKQLGPDIPVKLANDLLNQADEFLLIGIRNGVEIYKAQAELLTQAMGDQLERGYVHPLVAHRVFQHCPSLVNLLNYETAKNSLNVSLAEIGFRARLKNIDVKNAASLAHYVEGMPSSPNPDFVLSKCIDSLRYIINHEADRGYFKFINRDYVRVFYCKGFSLLDQCKDEIVDEFLSVMSEVIELYNGEDERLIIDPDMLKRWLQHDSCCIKRPYFAHVIPNHMVTPFPAHEIVVDSRIVMPKTFWANACEERNASDSLKITLLAICEYLHKADSEVDIGWACRHLSGYANQFMNQRNGQGLNKETFKVLSDYFTDQGIISRDRLKVFVAELVKTCNFHPTPGLTLRVLQNLGLDDQELMMPETSRYFLESDMGL